VTNKCIYNVIQAATNGANAVHSFMMYYTIKKSIVSFICVTVGPT